MGFIRHIRLGCMGLFLLPFALSMLVFDGFLATSLARQFRTLSYASVPGTITRSAAEAKEGRSFHFEVRYTYEVQGRTYEGSKYRSFDWGSDESSTFDELTSRFPVGATVPVFYPPEAPGEAMLVRGPQGFDFFVLLFVVPFNLFLLGGPVLAVLDWKEAGEGVRAVERDGRTHVTMGGMTPVLAGFVAVGGTALACTIGLAPVAGFQMPLAPVLGAWVLLGVVGVVVAKRQRRKLEAGDYDLIIDPLARSLSLPAMHQRKERLNVAWSQIRSISVETQRSGRKGKATSLSFCPTLEFTEVKGKRRREVLASHLDPESAGNFVSWLESQVQRGGPGAKSWSVG